MKFYQVYEQSDAGASDVFFPTKMAADKYIRETYGWPAPEGVTVNVHEHKGPLTKDSVCAMLTNWPMR